MGLLDGIRGNVLVLGVVSFFTDVSSEMIFPLLPLFLTTYLGASTAILGLIEGIADSLSSLFDIFFGYWSDKSGNRKRFVFLGYGFSSLSKIGIALANSWPLMLVFRGLDRVGKSIRTSPRDALIAASTEKSARGKAFGLHRAMDSLGAVAGPIIAYLILSLLGESKGAYQTVFAAAVIPALIAVAVILLFVREPRAAAKPDERKTPKPPFWKALSLLGNNYTKFVLISCLFSLSYFSFALLIVRAGELKIDAQGVLLAYIIYNVVYTITSIPIGQLSDRIGRKPVIAGAFALYALVCVGFALATPGSFWPIALLFAIYGIFVAADESVNKAYVADLVGEERRGLALGAYNTAVGISYLPANILFGALWAALGGTAAFAAAAGVAVASAGALVLFAKGK